MPRVNYKMQNNRKIPRETSAKCLTKVPGHRAPQHAVRVELSANLLVNLILVNQGTIDLFEGSAVPSAPKLGTCVR